MPFAVRKSPRTKYTQQQLLVYPEKNQRMKSKVITALLLGLLAFATYSCMYAIRKPFAGFIYEETLWGWNIKSWMVIAQLLGYTLSKFFGIGWIGQLKHNNRRSQLILLLFSASIPLWVLPFSPINLWPILMLANGFPLGIVWGIVFSYVEGRDLTEFIGAILACTFVFSSGFVKYAALELQNHFHMPAVNATATLSAIACILAAIFSYFLDKTPAPTLDEASRNAPRKELNKLERKTFFGENLQLLIPAILIYAILTFLRDFRDNFTAELLLESHNYSGKSIAQYETLITLILLASIPFISLIKNHLKAIQLTFITAAAGCILSLIAVYLYHNHALPGSYLLLISGLGLYAGYILINISIMNRIIGFRNIPGNCGFLMYSADSTGYLSSIVVMSIALFQHKAAVQWFPIFEHLLTWGSVAVIVIALFPIRYCFLLTKK